jgi:hypothetical protein
VLEGRGFSPIWITWIRSILEGSKIIYFNDQLSEYFSYKRGVRPDNLLSS